MADSRHNFRRVSLAEDLSQRYALLERYFGVRRVDAALPWVEDCPELNVALGVEVAVPKSFGVRRLDAAFFRAPACRRWPDAGASSRP